VITGTVADFDEHLGWGTVRSGPGAEHFFHCTAIADGTRTIAVGAAVRYRIVPGRLGRWEAAEITPGKDPGRSPVAR
jgi:cold shock CspA family protein